MAVRLPEPAVWAILRFLSIVFAAALASWPSARCLTAEKTDGELAKRAEAILKKHCYGCHGDAGFAESDFYVMEHSSLVPTRVTAGKPEQSLLIKKVRSGQMPKDSE